MSRRLRYGPVTLDWWRWQDPSGGSDLVVRLRIRFRDRQVRRGEMDALKEKMSR